MSNINTEVKKELYKSKAIAKFDRLENGKIYYNVTYDGGLYQFPMDLEETKTMSINLGEDMVSSFNIKVPAADMKGASFGVEVRGSDLNRWISRAIDNGNFIKIG